MGNFLQLYLGWQGMPDGMPTLNSCRRCWPSDLLASKAAFNSAVSCFSLITIWSALRASAAKCSVLQGTQRFWSCGVITEEAKPECWLQ